MAYITDNRTVTVFVFPSLPRFINLINFSLTVLQVSQVPTLAVHSKNVTAHVLF